MMKYHSITRLLLICLILLTSMEFVSSNEIPSLSSGIFGVVPKLSLHQNAFTVFPNRISHHHKSIFQLRAGASKRKNQSRTGSLNKTVTGKKKVGAKIGTKKPKTVTEKAMQIYKDIPMLTRWYMTAIVGFSLLGLVLGEERAQAVFALDPMRVFFGWEIWRPITAAFCLGKLSMNWIFNSYYLATYGTQLEKDYGPAQFLVFLISQLILLTMFASLMGLPFYTQCVITAMLHCLSRESPNTIVKWLFFKIPYWTLPYGLALVDALQAQSLVALVPHIIGILSGHFYHFHRYIWPKIGGEDWLAAPDFLIERIDPNAASRSSAKDSINKALKNRKRKGKKLGTA